LSFSLDDLKVGPKKLRLLFSSTGSAMGVTCIGDSGSISGGERVSGVECHDESGCDSDDYAMHLRELEHREKRAE
jgi:hypothetical protein